MLIVISVRLILFFLCFFFFVTINIVNQELLGIFIPGPSRAVLHLKQNKQKKICLSTSSLDMCTNYNYYLGGGIVIAQGEQL